MCPHGEMKENGMLPSGDKAHCIDSSTLCHLALPKVTTLYLCYIYIPASVTGWFSESPLKNFKENFRNCVISAWFNNNNNNFIDIALW